MSSPGTHRTLACLLIALCASHAWSQAAEPGNDQYAVAAAHYARGRWQLAVDEFDALLRDFPECALAGRAKFFRAEAQLQLGQYAEARRGFLVVAAQETDESIKKQASFRAGESAFLGGADAEAKTSLEAFRAAWPADPLNAYALTYLGEIALRASKMADAKQMFERSLAEYPDGALQDDCRYGLARALEEQGSREAAGRTYLALAGKRGSPLADDAQFRLAALQYAAGDFPAAMETLAAFDAEFSGSELRDRARLSRGWAFYQQGRHDAAEAAFAALIAAPSVGIEARYWLASCKQTQQANADAATAFAAVADDHPQHDLAAACRFRSGECWRLAKETTHANNELDKCLAAWPQGEWADDCLLCKLRLAIDGAQHDEAARLAAALKTQFPQSDLLSESRLLHARSLLTRKQFQGALDALQPPNSTSEQYLAALCYQGLSKPHDALAVLAKATGATDGADAELLVDCLQLQAAVLISLDDHRQAQAPLQRLLKDNPDSTAAPNWLAQLAVCQARAGELGEAKKSYRSLATTHPQSPVVATAARQLGDIALNAGDAAWSSELFASLVEGQPTPAVASQGLAGLAWSRFQNKDFAAADVAFIGLLAKKPPEDVAAEAAYMHGVCRERLSDDAAALTAYAACARDYPATIHAGHSLLALARLHAQRRDFAAAIVAYKQLVVDHATYSQRDVALYEWAWALRDADRAAEADDVFARLRTDCPQSRYRADATYRLAESARAANKLDEAKRLLAELTSSQPDVAGQPHVLYLSGQIAAAGQHWPEAATSMKRLVAEHPDSEYAALAEFWSAEAAYRQGDYPAAREAFDKVGRQVDDRNDELAATTKLRRAQLLALERNWAEAAKLVVKLPQEHPSFSLQHEADYLLGRCHASRGEFEEARAVYGRVVTSPRGAKTETAAMAQWMIGESRFHQKQYSQALREYLKVEILYAYPNWQAAALLQAGKCCEQLGQGAQAAEHYARAVDQFPQTEFAAEAKKRLADVKSKLKK